MQEYKYIDEFYKAAYISPQNIVLQQIDTFGNRIRIFIIEQDDNIRLIKADGDKDKPIKWSNTKHMILSNNEFEELKKIGGAR
jgi:hypothetical protein